MQNNSKQILVLFFSILLSFSSFARSKVQYPDSLKQINKNFIEYFKAEAQVDIAEVSKLLLDMDTKGAWPSIDYQNTQRGNWPVLQHLRNLHPIVALYKTKGNKFYGKKQVSKQIHLALNYWLINDFKSNNWWYPQIGTPQALAPLLILMENELSEQQLQQAMVLLNRSKIGMTGQNKVWLSANVLMRSMLAKDIAGVQVASSSIREELRVGMREGIQPDWSYQQHGTQLQFGNYGLHYIEDMTQWIAIFSQSPFAFDSNKMAILRNYILNGLQWVVWKDAMDISACGRQLFIDEPVRKKEKLLYYVSKMQKLDSAHADAYKKLFDFNNTIGNRHFYRTDFQVQRTKDYYFSVKMCSRRVLGAESCNDENMLGYYMGDGVALLYQSEKEYENIFPFWDWKKIPGTTLSQDTAALPVLTAWGYSIQSDFVGGVSDNKNGIAVMQYNRDNVKANKSWFMFNDMVVCLGSNINSTRGFTVATTANQSFLNGDVIIGTANGERMGAALEVLESPQWILHDNVGYIFPKGGSVHLEAQTVTGAWNKVVGYYSAEEKQTNIFKLWVDNGVNPVAGKYAYILVPNATKQKMQALNSEQAFAITNESDIQTVESVDGRVAGVVFYKAGVAQVFGGIEVTEACVAMLKKTDKGVSLFVADPTQKLTSMQLILNESFSANNTITKNGKTIVNINFPKGFDAGKTVHIELEKSKISCLD